MRENIEANIFVKYPFSFLLYNGSRVFPGGKERLRRDAENSPPPSAVVKK